MVVDFYQGLLDQREAKLADRARLDAELNQLDQIIKLYEKAHDIEPSVSSASKPRSRSKAPPAKSGSVKAVVMNILRGHPEGVTAADILAEADRMGHKLNRGTVASLLSVENKAGNLHYDEVSNKYRINANPSEAPAPEGSPIFD